MDYWAEEYTIPLCIISDTRQAPFGNDFLCLYKDDTSRLYFLNERWEAESRAGYESFRTDDFLDAYSKETERVMRLLSGLGSGADAVDFFRFIEIFREWQKAYFQTEAVRTERLSDGSDPKISEELQEAARLRLKLRMGAEDILYKRFDAILERTAEGHAMKLDDLCFYRYSEMRDLFRKGIKVRQSVLEERKRGYAFWRTDNESRLEVADRFREVWERVLPKPDLKDATEFRGAVANRGIVRGEVQLVLHNRFEMNDQVNAFQDGRILVTEMTRPQTLAACRKARAIITDEGGVTCHAAIYARETGTPCIIGTKMATKVLKTGDLVEVDADSGIVRVLERASG